LIELKKFEEFKEEEIKPNNFDEFTSFIDKSFKEEKCRLFIDILHEVIENKIISHLFIGEYSIKYTFKIKKDCIQIYNSINDETIINSIEKTYFVKPIKITTYVRIY
jgi:hypothetical protein